MAFHFPAEIYSSIFHHLSKPDLQALLTTARSPSHEAERILYTVVQLTSERQLIGFISPGVLTPSRAFHVRRLELGVSYYRTQQHIAAIHKVLKGMSRLRALRVNDSDGLLPLLRCQSLRLERLECSRVLMRRFDGKPVQHAVDTLNILDAPASVARSLLPGPPVERLRIVMEHHGEAFLDVPVPSVKALNLRFISKWNGGVVVALPRVFPNLQYLRVHVLDEPVFMDELFRSLQSALEQLPHLETFDIAGEVSLTAFFDTYKSHPNRFFEASESLKSVRTDHWMWERGEGETGRRAGVRDPKAWMNVELNDVDKLKSEGGESGTSAWTS